MSDEITSGPADSGLDPADDPVAVECATRPAEADLLEDDGTWMLTLVRAFPSTPQQVWRLLTDPEQLARWSPVVPDRPLTSTGPATSTQAPDEPVGEDNPRVDAEVLALEVPTADSAGSLVHRWGESILGWAIEPHGDMTMVSLDQVVDDRAAVPMMAAGWHICLAVLAALLDGVDAPRAVGQDALRYDWEGLRDRYEAHFVAAAGTTD